MIMTRYEDEIFPLITDHSVVSTPGTSVTWAGDHDQYQLSVSCVTSSLSHCTMKLDAESELDPSYIDNP